MSCTGGHHAAVGVLIPSTNTVVEYEYNRLVPEGVSVHAGRIPVPRPSLDSDANTANLVSDVRDGVESTIANLITCKPDIVLMGMSAITFYGGLEGAHRYHETLEGWAGRPVVSASLALLDVLRNRGVERIAVLSPYQPVNDREVQRFFDDAGIEITAYESLRCTSATQIAEVGAEEVAPVVERLAASSPDAVVQVGTNLWFADLSTRMSDQLGLPVVAINTATVEFGLGVLDGMAHAPR